MRLAVSLFRDKRGVSEIVASLILILIVSAAGVLAYSLSLSAFSSSTDNYRVQTDLLSDQSLEHFEVLAVNWDLSDGLNLTVLNFGFNVLAVDRVYVDGIMVLNYVSGRGVELAPSGIVGVSFVSPVPVLAGEVYQIVVVSERGSRYEMVWQA